MSQKLVIRREPPVVLPQIPSSTSDVRPTRDMMRAVMHYCQREAILSVTWEETAAGIAMRWWIGEQIIVFTMSEHSVRCEVCGDSTHQMCVAGKEWSLQLQRKAANGQYVTDRTFSPFMRGQWRPKAVKDGLDALNEQLAAAQRAAN